MTTNETSAPTIGVSHPARPGPMLILASIGFVLLYLGTSLAGNLASSALPLPNAPLAETRAWFAENQLAAVVTGLCQVLSVAALAVFVTRFRGLVDAGRRNAARWATVWGWAAVGLMMLSSVIAWLMAALAPGAGLATMSVLRTANFIAGGTAHVVALGIFVLLASRIPGMSKPIRVFGYVAAVPAVLSLVSLVWFYGAALILLGRLLCMAWTISAAVSVTRRLAKGTWF